MEWTNHCWGRLIMSTLLLWCALGMLASTASAGHVRISQADTFSGCGASMCTIPAHELQATGVHGCTGRESQAGRAGQGSLRYERYKKVCGGGEFSIDWRIKPLRLQFRNSAGDFEECLLETGLDPRVWTPLPQPQQQHFKCNMG